MTRRPRTMVPGETVLLSKKSTLFLSVADVGIKPSLLSRLLGGRVPIEGTLILTNYRLAFSPSPWEFGVREFGVALPHVRAVSDTSRGVWRTIRADTEPGIFEFGVWGIPALLVAIDAARESFAPDDLARIAGYSPEASPPAPR